MMAQNLKILLSFCFAAVIFPSIVSAQTLFQVAGVLNIFVGLMATASIVVFIAGLAYYFGHTGLARRVVGIHIMEWGVAMAFVLIVLLAFVRFVRLHTDTVLAVASFAFFILLILTLIHVAAAGGKKKEE